MWAFKSGKKLYNGSCLFIGPKEEIKRRENKVETYLLEYLLCTFFVPLQLWLLVKSMSAAFTNKSHNCCHKGLAYPVSGPQHKPRVLNLQDLPLDDLR